MPPSDLSYFELGQFIPLHYHYNMLLDTARMQGFQQAIMRVVPEGAKVLELGAGTGVLSHFAAQRASRVWAVERNPELAREARRILVGNPHAERVEVVLADAFEYLPPEPVDVVICEMVHVGMVREKQLPIIANFKERYLQRFGAPLPRFIPEAFIQAVQPVQQSFDFHGYYAPVPLFQDPLCAHPETLELADPLVYQIQAYDEPYGLQCRCDEVITVRGNGVLNALRFITKNVLAVLVETQDTIDWYSQYLVLPLDMPLAVCDGDQVRITFSYTAGCGLSVLGESLQIESCSVVRSAAAGV